MTLPDSMAALESLPVELLQLIFHHVRSESFSTLTLI